MDAFDEHQMFERKLVDEVKTIRTQTAQPTPSLAGRPMFVKRIG
jgi:hypothetical protein